MTARIPIRSQLLVVRVLIQRDAVKKIGARPQEADMLDQFLGATLRTLEWLEPREGLIKALREHPDVADAAMAEIERRRRGEAGRSSGEVGK